MSANTSKSNGSLADYMMTESATVQQRLSTGTNAHLPAASSATFLYGDMGTPSSAPAPPVRSSSTLKKERPMISPPSKPLPTPPLKKEKKRKVKLFGLPLFNRGGSAEPSISAPMDVKHDLHVVFDQKSGDFLGMPSQWVHLLKTSNISSSEQAAHPDLMLGVLQCYDESAKPKEKYMTNISVVTGSSDSMDSVSQSSSARCSSSAAAGAVPARASTPPVGVHSKLSTFSPPLVSSFLPSASASSSDSSGVVGSGLVHPPPPTRRTSEVVAPRPPPPAPPHRTCSSNGSHEVPKQHQQSHAQHKSSTQDPASASASSVPSLPTTSGVSVDGGSSSFTRSSATYFTSQ